MKLLDYRKDIASQFGEDGIIEKIFQVINPATKWCVEFGAWDGKHFSNTYHLIQNGWSGVLIEGDEKRCKQIEETHRGKDVYAVNAFVRDNLDEILATTPIPKDFDFLSIDIDGNDYHAWKALKEYKPKVVVIEFNCFIPSNIEFVQENNPDIRHGNSILSITKLANEKGYELVCINQENAFYVLKEYLPLFNIKDNSIDALKHYREPLQVFQLYDGTFVFHGAQGMYYYGYSVDLNRRFQIFPQWLRRMNLMWDISWLKNPIKRILFTLILRFYRRINRGASHNIWDFKSKY